MKFLHPKLFYTARLNYYRKFAFQRYFLLFGVLGGRGGSGVSAWKSLAPTKIKIKTLKKKNYSGFAIWGRGIRFLFSLILKVSLDYFGLGYVLHLQAYVQVFKSYKTPGTITQYRPYYIEKERKKKALNMRSQNTEKNKIKFYRVYKL